MRRFIGRSLISLVIALPLATQASAGSGATRAARTLTRPARAAQGGLSPTDVRRLAQTASQRVIVLLANQHTDLPARGAAATTRAAALAADQAPLLQELTRVGAAHVRAYHLINAVAATVSPAEVTHLQADPQVQAVVPDLVIRKPMLPHEPAAAPSGRATAASLPPCTFSPSLEPEALQLTDTAFKNAAVPQAQTLVTGTGVTVAFLADGVDPTNPDFIRPDGTPVFVDYQDFSGDGLNAPTAGAEAFGDASSIAAQGNETYNVNDVVNVAHKRPVACPQIKVLGMAPGASLMGLKIFANTNQAVVSNVLQALQYAVDHGADVINESFGANPYPDTGTDPISLADAAAVDAGVTVVASTGDAGTAGTLGSPSTDPGVIAVGGTTQFRAYAHVVNAGIQLGNGGYVDDNISSLSSGGIAQNGRKTVDVVAPADLGWALCSPNTAIYAECTDLNGNPTPIQVFGGTSESSPLTAGEAALVIQAYRQAHGGASPTPALVKKIIKSTATDLGIPSYEQGAGLIDSLRAVQAALSIGDANGHPSPQGTALLEAPDTLAATERPNTAESFPIQITNAGALAQRVQPIVRTLGAPAWQATYTVSLDAATDPTFVDAFGAQRAYVEQDFTVPAGMQRLDAAIAWDVVTEPGALARLSLFDPQNRLVAYSIPQDPGGPVPNSGYGHVDVRMPTAGVWRAIIWTRAGAIGYSGPVHLSVSAADFTTAGLVVPATRVLQPGQTATFTVLVRTPNRPGDLNGEVAIVGIDAFGRTTWDGAIPLILRSLVPLGAGGGNFAGLLTGGNGRGGQAAQTLTYQFDVPAGLHDLDLSLGITDTNYNLEGVLVDPNGLPLDVQSTVTTLDPATLLPAAYTNRMQVFRRDPQPGRWTFLLLVDDNVSGAQTVLPFLAAVRFNTVRVQSSAVPNDTGTLLAQGQPVVIPITITNTGVVTKDFFIDPRLAQQAPLALGSASVTLPLSATEVPVVFVPPESTEVSVMVEASTPNVPLDMDIANGDGAPPYDSLPFGAYGAAGSPDIQATPFIDPMTGAFGAVATSQASEVVPGIWLAAPSEVGPYATAAPQVTAQLGAVALTQQFDAAVSSNTGNAYAVLTGQAPGASYTPLMLAPGASGTIDVTFTPDAAHGTVVQGFLYVDTFASSQGFPITNSGDELVAIPYTYTVK